MAMKFDKDALIKHRFWITLGVFALLWIVSLSVLWAYAGAPTADAQKNYKDASDAATKYQHPKNDSFLPPWQQDGELFKNHKNEVWKIAWEGDPPAVANALPAGQAPWQGQAGMYDWPRSDDHPLDKLLAFPDSDFAIAHREWYKGNEDNPVYRRQFDTLYWELNSTAEKPGKPDPNGPPGLRPLDPVSLKGNDYYGLMKPVVNFEASTKAPSVEECWLAQEDFWVKREVLYVLRDALQTASRMDPADDQVKEPLDPKYIARRVFRNASWQVTLLFDRGDKGLRVSPDSTIKNIHVSRRDQELSTPQTPSGVWFRLRQGGATTAVGFEGERVAWDQERVMGKGKYKEGHPVVGGDPTQPMELEQVFDVINTPIARVDEIAVPKVSHHNANVPLLPTKPERYGKIEAAPADKTPATAANTTSGGITTSPTGATTGMGMMGTPPNMGSALGPTGLPGQTPGGQQASSDMTANKFFDRDRYLFVTDQSRHLPLAVTLIVDQSHLHEVLVAFANSRLRFQTTQVEFRRVPTAGPTTQPNGTGAPEFGPGPPPGGTSNGPVPGATTSRSPMSLAPSIGSSSSANGPPGGIRSPTSPMIPGLPGGAQTPEQAAPTHENQNLVEVTIYGIASLYERPR